MILVPYSIIYIYIYSGIINIKHNMVCIPKYLKMVDLPPLYHPSNMGSTMHHGHHGMEWGFEIPTAEIMVRSSDSF